MKDAYHLAASLAFIAMMCAITLVIVASGLFDLIEAGVRLKWLLLFDWQSPIAWASVGLPAFLTWAFDRASRIEDSKDRKFHITKA